MTDHEIKIVTTASQVVDASSELKGLLNGLRKAVGSGKLELASHLLEGLRAQLGLIKDACDAL